MQPARPTRPTSRSSSGGGGRQRSKSPTETTSTEATIKPQRTRCEIQTNDKGECYLCGRPGHKDEFSHPLDDDWETAKKPEEIKKWICKNCNTSNPMSYNFCGNCQQPGGDDDDDEDDDDDDDDDDIELDDGEFGEY